MDRQQEEITNFLESVSLTLGFAHGSLATILQSPDNELRGHIETLKHELDKRVSKLYYGEEIK